MALSLEAGRVVTTKTAQTFADGMACRVPDLEAFAITGRGAERIVRVTDDEVAVALRAYWDRHPQPGRGRRRGWPGGAAAGARANTRQARRPDPDRRQHRFGSGQKGAGGGLGTRGYGRRRRPARRTSGSPSPASSLQRVTSGEVQRCDHRACSAWSEGMSQALAVARASTSLPARTISTDRHAAPALVVPVARIELVERHRSLPARQPFAVRQRRSFGAGPRWAAAASSSSRAACSEIACMVMLPRRA